MYEKLKAVLKERDLSVNKLSFGAMISPSDPSTVLSGKKPMYPNWRKRICEYLQLPEEELFEDGENRG